MIQPRHRPTPRLSTRTFRLAAAFLIIAAAAAVAGAQTPEWRLEDNPYQEDVAYSIGEVFEPGVAVDGVRWLSFTIAAPDPSLLVGTETFETEVLVSLENRRAKSAKVLLILLLEDADGNPLERVEIRQFKVPGNRLRERTEAVEFPNSYIDDVSRAYIFFEILQ